MYFFVNLILHIEMPVVHQGFELAQIPTYLVVTTSSATLQQSVEASQGS